MSAQTAPEIIVVGGVQFFLSLDALNRLLSVTGAPATSYAYDGLDRRTQKTVAGLVTRFLHGGSDEIAEYSSAGALLRRYVPGPGPDERAAMIDSGSATPALTSLSFAHVDRLGSPMSVTDSAGAVTQRFAYSLWGESTSAPTGYPFRYTDQRLDPETGLMFYKARTYSSALGRFLQVDPIGTADDMNMYAYVGNDPANKTDPTGMCVNDPNCFGAWGNLMGPVNSRQTPDELQRVFNIGAGSTYDLDPAAPDFALDEAIDIGGQIQSSVLTNGYYSEVYEAAKSSSWSFSTANRAKPHGFNYYNFSNMMNKSVTNVGRFAGSTSGIMMALPGNRYVFAGHMKLADGAFGYGQDATGWGSDFVNFAIGAAGMKPVRNPNYRMEDGSSPWTWAGDGAPVPTNIQRNYYFLAWGRGG